MSGLSVKRALDGSHRSSSVADFWGAWSVVQIAACRRMRVGCLAGVWAISRGRPVDLSLHVDIVLKCSKLSTNEKSLHVFRFHCHCS